MLLAVGAFCGMDAFMKVLSLHYSPMQITAIRGLSSLPLILPWIALQGGFGQLLRVRFRLHVLRAVLGVMMITTFVYGLRFLPLGEVYSLFFVAPLLITVLAAAILHERVGRDRWIAVAVGFIGVLVVLRPSGRGALTLAGLAVVACAIGYALTAITVRVLMRTDTTQSMVFWLLFLMGGGALLLALPTWTPISREHWPAVAGIAVTGSIGQWAITAAFRRAEASFLAPLEYTALAWGLVFDWAFWNVLPTAVTLVGAGVIIASGIYVIRGERVQMEVNLP
jgi:drug/metabolite transporter (DMT)-like permease